MKKKVKKARDHYHGKVADIAEFTKGSDASARPSSSYYLTYGLAKSPKIVVYPQVKARNFVTIFLEENERSEMPKSVFLAAHF